MTTAIGDVITSRIQDRTLLRTDAFVDGGWVGSDSGARFPVLDPGTGELLAEVPRLGRAETARAIEAARLALPGWRARTAVDRSGSCAAGPT